MRLKAIKIANFKSLRETGWIDVFDLTAFIGENDGGKTACTEAIRLLCNKIAKPDPTHFTYETAECRATEMTIEAKLEIADSDRTFLQGEIDEDTNRVHLKKILVQDVQPVYRLLGQVPEQEEFREDWKARTIPDLKELAGKYSVDLTGLSRKAEIIDQIQNWVKEQPTVEGERTASSSLLDCLPRVEIFSSSEAPDPEKVINSTLKLLCDNEIASDKYRGQVKEIEQGITETLREQVSDLTPYIKRYYAEVESTTIDPTFSIGSGLTHVPLQLSKQGGGAIRLQDKGEGKKQQVTLGIYEWTTEALKNQDIEGDVVLIMDEPDTHMDYYSQRRLFDVIQSYVSPSIQVLICTHSLNLIDRMPIGQIHHFGLSSEDHTEIQTLKAEGDVEETKFVNEIGLSLGLSVGTMFHERCFLIVEGQTEMLALPNIFKLLHDRSLQSAGIKLLSGESNSGARNFAKFLNQNDKNVVFLLDSDCKTGPRKRTFTLEKLERDGFDIESQVFFVGQYEFEDAFEDDILAQFANDVYPKDDDTKWLPEEFTTLREHEKFSSSLENLLEQFAK